MSARPGVIVTMDGPAGTGKSSVAWKLAQRLGLEGLATGAMYRAAAVVAIDEGVPADDGAALAARIAEEGLAFDWSSRPPRMLLGGRDLTERIRDADVNTVVSIVARQAPLRAAMVRAQREIGRDTPSFAESLRRALRQDPDVILVGELRDAETMRIALQAADTGHLVFSTVHTTNASFTMQRIVAMFPSDERELLQTQMATNLSAVISQRLAVAKLKE